MSNEVRKIAVCTASALTPGSFIKYESPDFPPLAVFNIEGEFHVIDDTCSHGEASLSDGELNGDEIECPFHAGTFCVRTGEAMGFPATRPVRVYRTVVDGDTVFAEIPVTQE
jgi:nitrite reductase/ring-hydroxylating ferredoxin subunit